MGIFRQAYMQWKALRLPWRKDTLAGTDLAGNLYFERFVKGAYRSRRHVIYQKDFAISDFTDDIIPVQWQAWMRHTRNDPPTIRELLQDIERRERMAENVRLLAERETQDFAKAIGGAPPSKQQQAFQKTAPGESFQPEDWAPSPATASTKAGRRARH
ncbi:hypothetical protein GQ54DRAFT_259952 [Martensiomyces pterosporus]|nr:hypothetical protein GQ54DRAFT_259952 [Martensiomyces pterosporus]